MVLSASHPCHSTFLHRGQSQEDAITTAAAPCRHTAHAVVVKEKSLVAAVQRVRKMKQKLLKRRENPSLLLVSVSVGAWVYKVLELIVKPKPIIALVNQRKLKTTDFFYTTLL